MPTPASQFDSPHYTANSWIQAVGLLAVAALALYLRTLATDSPFTSADHIMIAYRTTCEPGWRWCFQNHYGPLQPLITKGFAHAVTGLGIPMTESLWRLPMGVVGAIIPVLAFVLTRQITRVALASGLMLGSALTGVTHPLTCDPAKRNDCLTAPPTTAAWFAAIWTAVLPPLVTDARYMWAYETLGTALALAVMIATFAYTDNPTRRCAWFVGLLMAFYLQSHLHVYAVPCVVTLILLRDRALAGAVEHRESINALSSPHCSQSSGTPSMSGRVSRIAKTPGLWLLPLISLFIIFAAWRLFGGGPIARVITKTAAASESPDRLAAALSLARAWLGHVGWLVAALVAIILVTSIARRIAARPTASNQIPRRAWFLMIWMILFAAPLFVLGFRTGRPTQYLTQATTVATILIAIVMFADPCTRVGSLCWRRGAGVLIAWVLLVGAVSANVVDKRPSQWLGITAAWGASVPNAGYKTAGWFVRDLVSPDAVVFALHDTSGLERPVAEYYFGRACVAAEDLSPEQSLALFSGLSDDIDIIVDDLRIDIGRPRYWPAPFRLVAYIRSGGTDLIHILARDSLQQKPMPLQPFITDLIYDKEYGPRRVGVIPPKSPRFPDSTKIRNLIRK